MATETDVLETHGKQETSSSPGRVNQLRWPWLLVIWLAASAVMASHRPSCLLRPVFWAEDGVIWFA